MTAAEVARKAADLLERDGWCQGKFRNSGAHCVVAALTAVDDWSAPEQAAVRRRLRVHAGTEWLVNWNDAPERTADEVIALLRQVATELEAS